MLESRGADLYLPGRFLLLESICEVGAETLGMASFYLRLWPCARTAMADTRWGAVDWIFKSAEITLYAGHVESQPDRRKLPRASTSAFIA